MFVSDRPRLPCRQNPTTFNNLLGIGLVLGGSLLYAVVRQSEMEAAKALATAAAAAAPGIASNKPAPSPVKGPSATPAKHEGNKYDA